jgi:hypothetical protein
MIQRALKLRNAIELYQSRWKMALHDPKAYNLRGDFLDDDEWAALVKWEAILSKFTSLCEREQSQDACGGQFGTISGGLVGLDFMFSTLTAEKQSLEDLPAAYHASYTYGIDCALAKVDKYYMKMRNIPLTYAAVALRPQWRFTYFEVKWKAFPQWIKTAKQAVRMLHDEYAEDTIQDLSDEPPVPEEQDNDAYMSFLQLPVTQPSRKRKRGAKHDDELDRYIRHHEDTSKLKPNDTIQWWIDHEKDYPVLASMAFDIFAIPSMSADVERVFSQSKKLITDARNTLSDDTIEACECIKNWLLNGVIFDV